MVKCEVINQELTVSMEKGFKKIKNIKRLISNEEITKPNQFNIGDTFETDKEYASYLLGETEKQPIVCIKVLEIIPDKVKIEKENKKIIEKIKKQKEDKSVTKKREKSSKLTIK